MKICKNKYFNYWQKKHLTLHVIELASVYTHHTCCRLEEITSMCCSQ